MILCSDEMFEKTAPVFGATGKNAYKIVEGWKKIFEENGLEARMHCGIRNNTHIAEVVLPNESYDDLLKFRKMIAQ